MTIFNRIKWPKKQDDRAEPGDHDGHDFLQQLKNWLQPKGNSSEHVRNAALYVLMWGETEQDWARSA